MAVQLVRYQEVLDWFCGEPSGLALCKEQTSWATHAVVLTDDGTIGSKSFNQQFVEWRVGRDLGRHTKLIWVPSVVFFEHDVDAMAFFLSFGQEGTL